MNTFFTPQLATKRRGQKSKRKNVMLKTGIAKQGFLAVCVSLLQKMVFPVLFLGLGVLGSVYLFPVMVTVFNPTVEKVVVNGDFLFMEKREVIENIDIYADERILDVNLSRIQTKLEAMPWVFAAQVSRQWPNQIVINVEEQKPIARWNEDSLFNRYGQLFQRQNKVVRNLPELAGFDSNEMRVLERYQQFANLLAPYDLQIVRLENNGRGGWLVDLNTQTRLMIGRGDALEKMRHFIVLYEEALQFSDKAIVSVDLRYDNGAAVSWREDQTASALVAAIH